MKIHSINNLYSNRNKKLASNYNTNFGNKSDYEIWEKACEKTQNIRDLNSAGMLLSFMMLIPTLLSPEKKISKWGKTGIGVLALTTGSMIYEYIKTNEYRNQLQKSKNV